MRMNFFILVFFLTIIPITIKAQGDCIISSSQSVNLRSGPGINFDVVDQFVNGAEVEAMSVQVGSDGFVWYYLSNDAWVRSDVIETSGACEDLPQYVDETDSTATPINPESAITTTTPVSNYTEVELQAISLESDTIVVEDFSDNSRGWDEEIITTNASSVSYSVTNGAYVYDFDGPATEAFWMYPETVDRTFFVEESVEFEIEVSEMQISRPDWFFTIGFNRRTDNIYGDIRFILYPDGTWDYGLVGFTYNSFANGELPGRLNLADGGLHRIGVRVQALAEGVEATLMINGEDVTTQYQDLPGDLYEQTYGRVFFGFAINNQPDSNQRNQGHLRVDNFIIRKTQPEALAEGTGLGPLTQAFQSDISRLTFQYPEGWYISSRRSITERLATNIGLYNITMYNSERGVAGGGNEIGFTIYEPAQVREEAQLTNTSLLELDVIIENFIRQREGASIWSEASEPETLELEDGRIAVRVSIQEENRDRLWLAFRSSDDSVTIMEILTSSGQLNELSQKALQIATTVDYPLPDQGLEDHEEIVRKFLITANSGLPNQAMNLMCETDSANYSFLSAIIGEAGGFSQMFGFATIEDFDTVVYSVNGDSRYFETVSLEDGMALVRVMGTLRMSYPTGEQVIVPHNEFFSGDSFDLFGADVYRVQQHEDGYWEVCRG